MSDKAERVAKQIAEVAWMTGAKAQYDAIVPDQIAAILREEYPEAANCYECKAGPCAGCPPLEMELCHRPAPDVSELREAAQGCIDRSAPYVDESGLIGITLGDFAKLKTALLRSEPKEGV